MNRPAALLVCLLILGGCTAPTATAPTASESSLATQTPTDGPDALPMNESRVYHRVAVMLDSDVAKPSVRTVDASDFGGSSFGRMVPFVELLLDADAARDATPAAYYEPDAHRVTVLLYDGIPADATNRSELEATLAHEYAHAVTYRDEQYHDSMLQAGGGGTTDATQVRWAMIEGTAMYVSDEYSERYLDEFDHGDSIAREYHDRNATWRYALGPYRFGGRYFDRRLGPSANLTRVYRTPPETTEQLIHDYPPDSEPPASLRVSVAKTDSLDAGSNRDTTGKLFVRDLLGAYLVESRAADAAAGWGNDRVVTLWDYGANESNQRNYLWVLRWDDGQNATEFQRAYRDYATARGERVGDDAFRIEGEQFRLERVSDETVAVVVGHSGLVERTRVASENEIVSVTVSASA
jgi:hypothetical protein